MEPNANEESLNNPNQANPEVASGEKMEAGEQTAQTSQTTDSQNVVETNSPERLSIWQRILRFFGIR